MLLFFYLQPIYVCYNFITTGQRTSFLGLLKSLKSLENYAKLTIRLSKVRIYKQDSSNGHGYRYSFTCDEIPECQGYGLTISDALEKFQKLAKLWINLVR